MIFVTVGTHEQPFNRLIKEIDELKKSGCIQEKVIVQSGFSTYVPQYCEWHKLIPYDEMSDYIVKARIVITHGGPASFIMPLQVGKIPIVVPRQYEYGEHVNNHQVDFAKVVAARYKNIIPVYDISNLKQTIENYNSTIDSFPKEIMSNNSEFNEQLESIVTKMFDK